MAEQQGRSRSICCAWVVLLWGKWLQIPELWYLHGGFPLASTVPAGHVLCLRLSHGGITVFLPAVSRAQTSQTLMSAGFVSTSLLRKSESRGLTEGAPLWKPTCYLSASLTSLSVPVSGTGGICQWLCHLLAAGRWLWLAPILFLLQLNSLNKSQELNLLK